LGGPGALQILALSRDVDLDASQGSLFNVALRTGALQHPLNPREYSALWQLSGARRRRNGFMPPPDEIERTRGKLMSAGLLVAVNVNGVAELGPELRVSLGEVELLPSLYEVLEGTRRLGFLGAFDALIFNACDGSRDVKALCANAEEQGYEATPADVQGSLARLSAAALVGVGPNGCPVRRPELGMRLDAVIARPPWGDVGYLLDPDESNIVERCRGGCTVGELMDIAGSDQDRAWIQSVVARACALGLTTVSAAAQFPAHFDTDFDERTTIEPIPTAMVNAAPVAPVAPPVASLPPRAPPPLMYAATSPLATPPAGVHTAPPQRMTPSREMQAVAPTRMTPPSGQHAAQRQTPPSELHAGQRQTPPSGLHAAQRQTPPSGLHAAQRPSAMTPAPGIPTRTTPPPYEDPYGGPPARPSGKLASLAALSLDKDAVPQPATTAARAPSSSKLPWVLLALVVAGGAFYHFKTVNNQAPAPPPTVGSGSATPTAPVAPHALMAPGYIAAKAPRLVSPKTSGRLEDLKVDTGSQVKQGQLLATVSDGQARSELTVAQARAAESARQVKTLRKFVKAQAATPVELEKAIGAYEIAAAEVRAAKQRLDETQIRSPIDGTVLEVLVRPGEAITGTAGVLRIANLNELVVEVNVGEADLRHVYMGQACDVTGDADKERIFKGSVWEIAEQADRSRGTLLVKVALEPITDGALKPGMAVQVRCMPPQKKTDEAGSAAGSADAPATTGSAAGSNAPAPATAGSAAGSNAPAPAAGSASGSAATAGAGSAAKTPAAKTPRSRLRGRSR
jgi:RND family efflux transporter MFP subunit